MSGPIAFTSLNAVTGTGAGGYPALNMPRSIHSMQVSFTGAPTAVIVNLEATINGTDWRVIATFDTGGGSVSGDILTVDEFPCLNVRANLTTLTAGASPTVTACIMQDSYN
jgi:hypothetical protein